MIDPATIGAATLDLLTDIEDEYGEDAEVVRTLVLIEVEYPHPDDDTRTRNTIQWRFTPEGDHAGQNWIADALKEASRPGSTQTFE